MAGGVRPLSDQQVIALANDVKTQLDALRIDFISHDHGSSYTTASIRFGQTTTPSGNTAVASAVALPIASAEGRA